MEVSVAVYASKKIAQEAFRGVVAASSGLTLDRAPNDFRIGDTFKATSGGGVCFTIGRAWVLVNLNDPQISQQASYRLTEALARGIAYHLTAATGIVPVMPGQSVRLGRSRTARPALIVGGAAWVPVATLEILGVQAKPNADRTVTLSYRGRTLVVTPLSSDAKQNGAPFDLGLPVLLQNDQVIVPAAPVAKALQLPVPAAVR